jgi:hypothetical protein
VTALADISNDTNKKLLIFEFLNFFQQKSNASLSEKSNA